MKVAKNNLGFTIIELFITIAIMCIILTIAVPKISLNSYYLKAQAQELCSDIREIKNISMTEGGAYSIILNKDFYKKKKETQVIKIVEMVKENELFYTDNLANNDLYFDYSGAPVHGGATIKIKNNKVEYYYEITIVPVSGRVLLRKIN